MSHNYFISAFGTFGNPNGFRQSYLFTDNSIANVIKGLKTFDLNTNAIKLFPKSKMYAIRKELARNYTTIGYSIYTYAKEPNSDRSGTFIGSSILFINKVTEESITINCLNEFHNNLKNKYVQNDTIIVNHSDKFSVSKPENFDKIDFHFKKVDHLNFNSNTGKILVVYCETNPDKLKVLFKNALDLLDVYDIIYFTESKEIAEFVHQKNIFQLVRKDGFENEIEKIQEKRRLKIQELLNDLSTEKQKLEEDEKKHFEKIKSQIEQNVRQHQENKRIIEESKNELSNISKKYQAYSRKIDESINHLKNGEKLEIVKQSCNENRKVFNESINKLEVSKIINSFSKPSVRASSNLLTSQPKSYNDDFHDHHHIKRKPEINIYKVISFILFILLGFTLTYFLIYKNQKKEIIYNPEPKLEQPIPDQIPLETVVIDLNPKPNTELNENDFRIVAKNILLNTSIDSIVEIIFKINPTDIKKYYNEQKEIYSKHLHEINKDCFEYKDGILYFVKDTLRHIPSYKTQENIIVN